MGIIVQKRLVPMLAQLLYKNDRIGYLNGALAKTMTTSKAMGADWAKKEMGKGRLDL